MRPPFDQTFAQLLERVTDAFIALDSDWRFIYVNQRAAEIFRRRPEDLIGHYIWTEFPEGIAHPIHRAYRQAAAEQRAVFIEDYYAPLERWFEHRIYPSPGGLSVFFQDVTARRQAAAQLEESRARIDLALESSGLAFWDWEIQANEVRYSREWKEQLGYAENEIQDQPDAWQAHAHPDDVHRLITAAADCVERRAPLWEDEVRMRHRDGHYLWFLLRGRLVVENGVPARMIGTRLDITERRQAEEALRTLSRRLLTAQEAERRRVARELHDQVGQMLTAVKIQLQSLQRASSAGPLTERLAETVQNMDRAITDVRGLAFELRPSLLDDLGLAVAVRSHAARFETETGTPVSLAVEPLHERLAPEIETACFRVMQEALTNVARHAHARTVAIALQRSSDALELRVRDDGVGFDVSAARRRAAEGECMGLSSMEERVRLAGGLFDIQARPGDGTEIRVHFELPARSAA